MQIQIIIFIFLTTTSFDCDANKSTELRIVFDKTKDVYKPLPRFWTNSGFSPSAPLPINRSFIVGELKSKSVYRNVEFIAALPNFGIKYIRIHWLLSLVEFKSFTAHKIPEYNFDELDSFLDYLMEIKLLPVIELMGDLFPHKNRFHDIHYMWKDFVYQFVSRYLIRYGRRIVGQWKFELWNEPDLHTYNILNYNFTDYLDYATGVAGGLKAAARRTNPQIKFELRGPAGLFKSIEKHPFCWGILNFCNLNASHCPIDLITFHRKGIDSSNDILINSINLIDTIHKIYPNLNRLPYANTEADPFAGWSKNYTTNANVYYAHTLINIVLQHWSAMFEEQLSNLESISHDNAFLSYHPFEFEQRTLLARFLMNETTPKTVQFIQKPVYAAFGLLSALAKHSTNVYKENNVSYVLSLNGNYAAVILISAIDSEHTTEKFKINCDVKKWFGNDTSNLKYAYFAEYLHINRTDPFNVWEKYHRPPYPNETVWNEMLHAQGPHMLKSPKVIKNRTSFHLNIKLHHPWIVLVRICSSYASIPLKIKRITFRRIDNRKLQIFWNDQNDDEITERCIQTYEIYYAPLAEDKLQGNWTQITQKRHVPFLTYCHQLSRRDEQLDGFYKIRAVDIFGRFGEFSKVHQFKSFA